MQGEGGGFRADVGGSAEFICKDPAVRLHHVRGGPDRVAADAAARRWFGRRRHAG